MKNKFAILIPHILGWAVFLSLPILFSPKTPKFIEADIGILFYFPILISCIALMAVFYFNYFILIPRYLFKKKYLAYLLSCLACMVLMLVLHRLTLSAFQPPMPFQPPIHRMGPPNPDMVRGIPLFFANALLMFLVTFLTSIVLQLNTRWKETEKERLSAQLDYLKNQINPHFLFNTLNSIYSVTIGKAPQASEMVNKLSQMMRYTLKEAQLSFVPLEKEINYIQNYIDLQKVRFDDSVRFNYEIKGDYRNKQIAPLLLIPFIENAFKHGVNSEQDSFIQINLNITGNEVKLKVSNNKVDIETDPEEKSGIGIKNTKSRLMLIYPNNHSLRIIDSETHFTVYLTLNLL